MEKNLAHDESLIASLSPAFRFTFFPGCSLVLPWVLPRPLDRAHHGDHPEILHADQAVAGHEAGREQVEAVGADPSLFLLRRGDPSPSRVASEGPLLPPCLVRLGGRQLLGELLPRSRVVHEPALTLGVGQGAEHRDAHPEGVAGSR